jgi:hypothetical protein
MEQGYTIDAIFLLSMIEGQYNLEKLMQNPKVAALHQFLKRKALISDEDRITTIGTELLTFMSQKSPKRIVKKKTSTEGFDRWWVTYPGTDTFSHKGKSFSGSRALRQNKEECRLKFDKIILEGEYSVDDMVKALEHDVLQKKEASIKEGRNKLTFMQNSLTYLNQRSFEPFIELIRAGHVVQEAPKIAGGTDV